MTAAGAGAAAPPAAPAGRGIAAAGAMYGLAGLLCLLYASDAILISFYSRAYADNPPGSKLVLLGEVAKLAISLALIYAAPSPGGGGAPGAGAGGAASGKPAYKQLDAGGAGEAPAGGGASARPPPGRRGGAGAGGALAGALAARAWAAAPRWARAAAQFSVPALCYAASNNLSIHALSLLPAYTYTLLCNLKIITTGLLARALLGHALSGDSQWSLGMLFFGICLGQWASMRGGGGAAAGSAASAAGTAGTTGGLAAAALAAAPGVGVMVVVATLSATASVYTEWLNNHSSFAHESINVQNARLYAIGCVLNGTTYLRAAAARGAARGAAGGGLRGALSLSDLRPVHWAVVGVFASMGLATAALIKFHGNIIKVYASALAMLFAAWASQLLLADPPPLLFYSGAALAGIATVQLHHARAAAPAPGGGGGKPGGAKAGAGAGAGGGGGSAALHRASYAILAVSALLVLAGGGGGPGGPGGGGPGGPGGAGASVSGSGAGGAQLQPLRSYALSDFPTLPADAAPPPPGVAALRCGDGGGGGGGGACPALRCADGPGCAPGNSSCCAHLNFKALAFLSAFFDAQGLANDWVVAHGTLLGALRDGALPPAAPRADVAVTGRALAALEGPAARAALHRHGYAALCAGGRWRLCPHAQHPDADFRAAMAPGGGGQAPPESSRGYVAMHLLWADRPPTGLRGRLRWLLPGGGGGGGGGAAAASWRVCPGAAALRLSFARSARVADLRVAVPDDAEAVLAREFGQRWRAAAGAAASSSSSSSPERAAPACEAATAELLASLAAGA
ncbi:CMP-sialic acid transporter 1 [Scenedesmus sp. PABB004]|nr:CMP-sialic acid transporter 1 [Scenedesmus sp. PABB004]